MTFTEWKNQVHIYDVLLTTAEDRVRRIREKRDSFLMKTIGTCPGQLATVAGTAEMIDRVLEMRRADRLAKKAKKKTKGQS